MSIDHESCVSSLRISLHAPLPPLPGHCRVQTDGVDPTVASVQVFEVIDVVVLGLFTAEIGVKVIAEGNMPLRFFHDSWNAFDLFVVILSFSMLATSISYVSIIRMVRLFRVLKLVRRFPQLRIIGSSPVFCVNLMILVFYQSDLRLSCHPVLFVARAVDVFIQMARPVSHTMLIFAVMNYIFAVGSPSCSLKRAMSETRYNGCSVLPFHVDSR